MAAVRLLRGLVAPLLLCLAVACAPLISEYNAESYKYATSLKAESLAMIDRATEPRSAQKFQKETDVLTVQLDAAYEFVAGLPNNQATAAQWQFMRDPNGNLFGAFVKRWRREGKISETYRDEKKIDIARGFDAIICLEVNKKDSKACSSIAQAKQ